MKIEEMMLEIDSIIDKLKSNNIEIDKSIELYNIGIELTNKCIKELEDKKLKIVNSNGEEVKL